MYTSWYTAVCLVYGTGTGTRTESTRTYWYSYREYPYLLIEYVPGITYLCQVCYLVL